MQVNTALLSEDDLRAFQLSVVDAKQQLSRVLAKTAKGYKPIDEPALMQCINDILEDGYNLIETKLSDYPEFKDVQHVKKWKPLIKLCVQNSPFNRESFGTKHLSHLRNKIEASNCLHSLRENVKLMIEPMQLHRDNMSLTTLLSLELRSKEADITKKYIDTLENQLQAAIKLAEDRKEVIDSIMQTYDLEAEGIDSLRKVKEVKRQHNFSDEQACKVVGISRRQYNALREKGIE